MKQVQIDDINIIYNRQYRAINNKQKPRKWREIEKLKAEIQLAKELKEIDPSFILSPSYIM